MDGKDETKVLTVPALVELRVRHLEENVAELQRERQELLQALGKIMAEIRAVRGMVEKR